MTGRILAVLALCSGLSHGASYVDQRGVLSQMWGLEDYASDPLEERPREAGNDIDERGSSSLDEYTRDVEDPFNLDLEDVLFETENLLETENGGSGNSGHRIAKRFTVDFNGMQVSYPTYVRLSRLQGKVIRLKRMIDALHQKYDPAQLAEMPQFERLMTIYSSLQPLLPKCNARAQPARAPAAPPADRSEEAMLNANPSGDEEGTREKRSGVRMDFMGMRVSYPQYLRLKNLQERVIKMDQTLAKIASVVPKEKLKSHPKWNKLVKLHASLRKVLPSEYLRKRSNSPKRWLVSYSPESIAPAYPFSALFRPSHQSGKNIKQTSLYP